MNGSQKEKFALTIQFETKFEAIKTAMLLAFISLMLLVLFFLFGYYIGGNPR